MYIIFNYNINYQEFIYKKLFRYHKWIEFGNKNLKKIILWTIKFILLLIYFYAKMKK
jgi:hypothetical protein